MCLRSTNCGCPHNRHGQRPQMTASAPSRGDPRSEREIIEAALAESRGRVAGPSGAAARLNIPASTLEHRIRVPEDPQEPIQVSARTLPQTPHSPDSPRFARFATSAIVASRSPALFSIVCDWRAACHANGQVVMACRIDRLLTEGNLVVLRISGRITGDDVDVLRAAIDQERGAVAIDLEEVGLVDRGAVTSAGTQRSRRASHSGTVRRTSANGSTGSERRRPGLFGARDISKTAPMPETRTSTEGVSWMRSHERSSGVSSTVTCSHADDASRIDGRRCAGSACSAHRPRGATC